MWEETMQHFLSWNPPREHAHSGTHFIYFILLRREQVGSALDAGSIQVRLGWTCPGSGRCSLPIASLMIDDEVQP